MISANNAGKQDMCSNKWRSELVCVAMCLYLLRLARYDPAQPYRAGFNLTQPDRMTALEQVCGPQIPLQPLWATLKFRPETATFSFELSFCLTGEQTLPYRTVGPVLCLSCMPPLKWDTGSSKHPPDKLLYTSE